MKPLVLLRIATLPFDQLAPLGAARALPLLDELFELEESLTAGSESLGKELYEAAADRSAAADPESARARLALVSLRRDIHNGRPLREPDLDQARRRVSAQLVERLELYAAGRSRHAQLMRGCRRACESDVLDSRSALLASLSEPLVEEGVRLASRSLAPRLRALVARHPSRWRHDERHVAAKAVAYLSRFCTKTSPNGLFCATAVVGLGESTIAIDGRPEIERVDVVLSVAEARKVAACLAADESIRQAIVPRPNPTLREAEGAWTFWKPASSRNPTDEEVFSRTKDQPVLRLFLEEAARGVLNVVDLIDRVASRCGLDAGDVEGFYRQLVERGLLIAEVEIPYNSRRPLADLARACLRADCRPPWLPTLEEVERTVDSLPSLAPAERNIAEERIIVELEALPHVRPLKPDELFRLDAASALRMRLPWQVIEELRLPLRAYVRLFAAIYPERIYRSALAARFLQEFPADTDVELLDLYHGVFEPEDKQRPVAFPEPARVAPAGSGTDEAGAALRRARELFARRAREIPPGEEMRIDEDELLTVVGGAPEPRWGCGVLFQIAAREPGDIDRGDYRLVLSALFQGAGLALARFAHLHGGGAPVDANPIVGELRRGWSGLECEGAIVAELTYNHNARTANAGLRPAIFRHEIELPGEKASAGAEVIPLRELRVRYDSARERFVLRWAPRDLEVVPVINSGVNPVGIISFLIAIGQQEIQPLGYFPGFEAEGVTRWPRCVCDRLVLFRERWAFGAGEWPGRLGGAVSPSDFFIEVSRWRRRNRIPRHVFVHTSADPKPRYLDLGSPPFVELLQRSVPAAAGATTDLHVTEMLPGPGELWISDSRGRFATEFLVHLQGPDGRNEESS